jgi:hypothetical protein
MRALAQRSQTAQQTTSARPAIPGWVRPAQAGDVSFIDRLQRSIGNRAVQRLLDVRAPAPVGDASEDRERVRVSGELEGGSLDEAPWFPSSADGVGALAGRGSVALAAAGGGGGGAGSGGAAPPTLEKTTVSPLATQRNGGFNWGVRWSIRGATSKTNGWIVQHVLVRQNVEAWHPPLLTGATLPIVPGQGAWGGLSTSWYPLWEAWQVRGGSVFVGGGAAAHKADTYGQDPVGPKTKGSTEVIGRADFHPNLTLPKGFTVRNAAPAWALPATNSDPKLTGGTGALDHNLTATWDGVAGNGTTTAKTA